MRSTFLHLKISRCYNYERKYKVFFSKTHDLIVKGEKAMNTYAQIIQGSQNFFGFLNLKFKDGKLKISVAQGLRPAVKWDVDLAHISGLSTDEFMGAKRIAFYDGQVEYILFETGIGVSEYLEDNLYAEV